MGRLCRHVIAPTLLIVGGRDEDVLELNRRALALLNCPKELVVVPGATHLFEEPGALEQVARLAEQWFLRHLCASRAPDAQRDLSATTRSNRSMVTFPMTLNPCRNGTVKPFRTMLFAADLSKNSTEAFRMACSLATEKKTRLFVLHVEPNIRAKRAGSPSRAGR